MQDKYLLEKWEWTDDDFEVMGWHDCPIYAIRFDDNIYLDIDYIFKWVDNGEGKSFTFWMAPATIVFENPFYLKIDAILNFINGIEIAGIFKEKNENGATIWKIDTQEGKILIGAEKYRQIIRRPPSFQYHQAIQEYERGDISFSLISEKNYRNSPDVIKRKESELNIYKLIDEKETLALEINKLGQKDLDTKNSS